MFQQHQNKEASANSKENKHKQSWRKYFNEVEKGHFQIKDPLIQRHFDASQAILDGDTVSANELSKSVESTLKFIAQKTKSQEPSAAALYKNEVKLTKEELENILISKIDHSNGNINNQSLKSFADALLEMSNKSKFIKNFLHFALTQHPFIIQFSPNAANVSYDKAKRILLIPTNRKTYDTVVLIVIFRHIYKQALFSTLDNSHAQQPPPYYPHTDIERKKFSELLSIGDRRIEQFYKIHMKKLNKQSCSIVENQEYAKYTNALKNFSTADKTYNDNLPQETADSLRKLNPKDGNIVVLSTGETIKIINHADDYSSITFQYSATKVREFYTLYLDSVISSETKDRLSVKRSSLECRSLITTQEMQRSHAQIQAHVRSDDEERIYLENRDLLLSVMTNQYPNEILETFYPEFINYQNQNINKALKTNEKEEILKLDEKEQNCRKAGLC